MPHADKHAVTEYLYVEGRHQQTHYWVGERHRDLASLQHEYRLCRGLVVRAIDRELTAQEAAALRYLRSHPAAGPLTTMDECFTDGELLAWVHEQGTFDLVDLGRRATEFEALQREVYG